MSADTKTVYAVYTNSDLTEGRGTQTVLCVCEIEATAIRMAKGKYVMGTDAPIQPITVERHGEKWFYPTSAVSVVPPTAADVARQELLDSTTAAIARAKAAGLHDADIELIRRSRP